MVNESPRKSTVLIVDDNPTNIEILYSFLNEAGFDVLVAQDGKSAIKVVSSELPDLILLDVIMPGIDGFKTCSQIKANPANANIPIIFMTALSQTVDKLKGLSLGAVDYVTKPFAQEEILARIQLHLKLYSLNRQLQQEIDERIAAQAALKQFNLELEKRVEERTIDLKNTLKQLEDTRDILLEREKKLEYDACHDALTNLPNRTWLMNRLKQLIQLSRESRHYSYAVLFIDLDRFKVVNDSLGHLVGDELLKSVARRLQQCLRSTDTVARLGGDEFIILVEQLENITEATNIACRIQQELKRPLRLNNYEIYTGASIGITTSSVGYQHPEDILRDADVALYRAKAKGKGRYEVLTRAIQKQALSRLHLENDLRRGIASQEFFLCYQPIVSLMTGNLYGFEALVRWQHPTRGWVSPIEFIPVAEETELINTLGLWVLQAASRQLEDWRKQFPQLPPLVMTVNLSPIQLGQVDLVEKIEELLLGVDLSFDSLKLEITESCLLDTVSLEANTLRQIKRLGLKLCIDDFGTGYSSLSRLHELPIDTVKIDRSFVSCPSLEQRDRTTEIVRTIISLAHSLEMDVVAEGIETKPQLDQLRSLGCELGQGYFFSKPLPEQLVIQRLFRRLLKQVPNTESCLLRGGS